MSNLLNVKFLNQILNNPIMPASGTFNFGFEVNNNFYNIDCLGAIVCKSITLKPKNGNKNPRVVSTNCGMLNAIGLENPGLENYLKFYEPYITKTIKLAKVIINLAGETIENYLHLINALNEKDYIFAFELNLSCPNVNHGTSYLEDESLFVKLISECKKISKKPILVKLSPEGIKITKLAVLAEKAGANALVISNTLKGMKIDLNSKKPVLNNISGGYSGSAIKPISLWNVYQCYKMVKIPIIGVGGINNAADVIEYILAGATCIQIGTANFINPMVMKNIIDDLPNLLKQLNITSIEEAIGLSHK